eukprot:2624427-Pleurochrysis_carterae.AAC.1
MLSPQRAIVTLAPSPASINQSPTTDPTTTANRHLSLDHHQATSRLYIRTAVSTPTFYWPCT